MVAHQERRQVGGCLKLELVRAGLHRLRLEAEHVRLQGLRAGAAKGGGGWVTQGGEGSALGG